MHIALWISGIGSLIFAALGIWPNKSVGVGDNFGAAFFVVLGCAALSGFCGFVWIVIVVIKAANA